VRIFAKFISGLNPPLHSIRCHQPLLTEGHEWPGSQSKAESCEYRTPMRSLPPAKERPHRPKVGLAQDFKRFSGRRLSNSGRVEQMRKAPPHACGCHRTFACSVNVPSCLCRKSNLPARKIAPILLSADTWRWCASVKFVSSRKKEFPGKAAPAMLSGQGNMNICSSLAAGMKTISWSNQEGFQIPTKSLNGLLTTHFRRWSCI
jgi:hypothetical protein